MSLFVERQFTSSDKDDALTKSREFQASHKNRSNQRSRITTSFAFAHPPPRAFYRKWRIQPKLLLQLQQLSDAGRPTPLIDILESTTISRIMAPMVFGGANRVGSNDLAIIKSGSYTKSEQMEEDTNPTAGEAVATASHPLRAKERQEGPVINFQNGPSWEITALPNGSYEFATNDCGRRRIVRWVRRRKSATRGTLPQPERKKGAEKHFAFSVINSGTRRHPVIATMTRASIEVIEHFAVPTRRGDRSSSPRESAASESSVYDSEAEPLDSGDPAMVAVSEELRSLILITGSWVLLKKGWVEEILNTRP